MTKFQQADEMDARSIRAFVNMPVGGQKVKGIGPGALEVLIGSREKEPARTTDRTAVAASFGHDFNT